MTDYNFNGLVTVTELAALRHYAGLSCATEQGIRAQIRKVQQGLKTPNDVGFEIIKGATKQPVVKILDTKLESFRLKINEFATKNAPK